MEQSSRLTGTGRRLRPITATLSLLISFSAVDLSAETSVYRCVAPDGKIEFRQTACSRDTSEEEVRIEDRKTGWEPPPVEVEKKAKKSAKTKRKSRKAEKNRRAAEARQEEKCWKKRRQIQEINYRLRRGYKPATGERLRHRRRVYEDYIRQFCK